MRARALGLIVTGVSVAFLAFSGAPSTLGGTVVDATTGAPIADAIVTLGAGQARSDAHGRFSLHDVSAGLVRARAVGYARASLVLQTGHQLDAPIALSVLRPKAVYLSMYGIGSGTLREPVLELIETSELNALVIDVKGDRGFVPYPSATAAAMTPDARNVTTIRDLPTLVAALRARGIYTIARLVVFKDPPLASARPDLAVRWRNGTIYRDREGLAWTSPVSPEVRRYNIAIAVEAAAAGFDEIQFDYVRLPDAIGLASALPQTPANRIAAIDTFLREAQEALAPHNVFVAADLFGYVCWNPGDSDIGQQLERMLEHVDYVSPMLYPSSFQFGIPGYRNPIERPYDIVYRSLDRAVERTHVSPLRFRPWLQAFRDYAFGGQAFTSREVRDQIRAAEAIGTDGWMLWNPQNRYARVDLLPDTRD